MNPRQNLVTLLEEAPEEARLFLTARESRESRYKNSFVDWLGRSIVALTQQQGAFYPFYEQRVLEQHFQLKAGLLERYFLAPQHPALFTARGRGKRYYTRKLIDALRDIHGENIHVAPGGTAQTNMWYTAQKGIGEYIGPLFSWKADLDRKTGKLIRVATFREPHYSVLAANSRLPDGRITFASLS